MQITNYPVQLSVALAASNAGNEQIYCQFTRITSLKGDSLEHFNNKLLDIYQTSPKILLAVSERAVG